MLVPEVRARNDFKLRHFPRKKLENLETKMFLKTSEGLSKVSHVLWALNVDLFYLHDKF